MNTDKNNASLVDAFLEGQDAGKLLLSPSLNPYQDDTPEYDAWERGRMGALQMRAARMVA